MPITYRQAGVDIEAADGLVDRIRPLAAATRTAQVLEGVGGFAGLCQLPDDIVDPVLVSGTDGVGTKLKLAFATGKHDTIGRDLVAMCVNDVITTGARPLFFLDYFACGKLDVTVGEQVVGGIAAGCSDAGCALLGGETAELPGMYPEGEYDLAGFSVGVVSRGAILSAARVEPDDALIAVASSGLHSNGYSLARHVTQEIMGLSLDARVEKLGAPLAEVLLEPTRIYARAVAALAAQLGPELHALAHITGGGVPGNLPRVLPAGVVAEVRRGWPQPPIFDLIAQGGPVTPEEMLKTFNLGVGMIAVVARGAVRAAVETLEATGEQAWELGALRPSETPEAARVEIV